MGLWDQFQCPKGRQGKIVAALMNKGHKALTTWGLSYVTIQPDYTILDVGCGGGKTINRLAQQVPQGKVYGIDCSPDMVAYAKKVNKEFVKQNQVEIHEASVDNTGLPDDFFDLVTACETYYFWFSLPEAFKEIKRVLKPNGKFLLISEMVKDGVHDVARAKIIEKTHVHLVPIEETSNMLQSAGFSNVEVVRKEDSAWNAIIAQKPAV
ncbi:MAG: class I SAM-dependent methyltransferase [Candidatus Bathyarchaeota archaeon]|nr:class I SAM-dependent methyltransferase [Candidatus Bathyarchaeota archaeon]